MRRLFWIIFGLMLVDYLAMVLWSFPHLAKASDGLMPFDLRPLGYSLEDGRTYLAALGAAGRNYYLNVQHKLDTAFPALEAVVFVVAFRWLYRPPLRHFLAALAVLGAAFDYLENAAVAEMLQAGSQQVTAAMVAAASRWTVLKSAAVTLAMLALLIGLARAILQKRRAQNDG